MGVTDKSKWAAAKKALGTPEDVPFFVIVGTDRLAQRTLSRYEQDALALAPESRPPEPWFERLHDRQAEFAEYASKNPTKMKVPD